MAGRIGHVMLHEGHNRPLRCQMCTRRQCIHGVAWCTIGRVFATAQRQACGVLMQTGAHEVNAGNDHAAHMRAPRQYTVDGGGGAGTDDKVVVVGAQGLRTQQLCKTIRAHLAGFIVSEGKSGCLLLRANDVNGDVAKHLLNQLLYRFKHRIGGHIADEAGGWAR